MGESGYTSLVVCLVAILHAEGARAVEGGGGGVGGGGGPGPSRPNARSAPATIAIRGLF